jgi:hypothetical protein
MPPQLKRVCDVETTWIREYAKTYLPSEAGFSFSADHLREVGLTLIGIRNIFRRGYVTFSDKLDGPGAVWIVEGNDNGGDRFRLTVTVISESLAVDLVRAERVSVEENDNDDAA